MNCIHVKNHTTFIHDKLYKIPMFLTNYTNYFHLKQFVDYNDYNITGIMLPQSGTNMTENLSVINVHSFSQLVI